MNAEIVLIRHGTTDSNNRGLLHGRTDTPLASKGIEQASLVANRLARLEDVHAVYSSPLVRARTTAELIASQTGLTPMIDPDLREFDFGDLEGVTFEDLQVRFPSVYSSLFDPDGFDHPFPNGESRRSIYERVSQSLDRITSANGSGRVIVVAHLIVIASAVARLTSDNPDDAINYLVENCSVTRLRLNGKSPADLIELNDVNHLNETERA